MATSICLRQFKFAVSKWPAAGQGLQKTKWPAVLLFPINLEICWVLSNETPLYLLRITKRFY